MHDTLDLAALQQQAQADRKQYDLNRKATRYYYIFALICVVIGGVLTGLILTRPGGVGDTTVDTYVKFLFVSVVLYFSWQAVNTYLQVQGYVARVRRYVPAYVPSPSPLIAIRFSGVWIVFAISPLLILLGRSGGLIIYVAAAVPYIVIGIYEMAYARWLQWISVYDRAEKLLRVLPNYIPLLNVKAMHLLNSGQLDEAEQLLRQLLTRATGGHIYSVGILLNNLGYCLLLAEKYEDSLPILESSIHIVPAFSYGYANLADWYLDQNLDYERAVELSDFALQYSEPKLVDGHAVTQAINARALAFTGRNIRAEATLEQALNVIERVPPNIQAEINRQAGHVRLAQGNPEEARKHFERAISLDPNGMVGKLARRDLDKIM